MKRIFEKGNVVYEKVTGKVYVIQVPREIQEFKNFKIKKKKRGQMLG